MLRRTSIVLLLTLATAAASLLATALWWLPEALAQQVAARAAIDPGVLRWGYMAAALATGLSSLAAGYAVATVGAAAIGALAEKPELLGRLLIFVGLAEGIAIYGLIISILILNQFA